MKKIFNILKKAVKWYFNALARTSAMCPTCMVPVIGTVYMNKVDDVKSDNKHSKKAA